VAEAVAPSEGKFDIEVDGWDRSKFGAPFKPNLTDFYVEYTVNVHNLGNTPARVTKVDITLWDTAEGKGKDHLIENHFSNRLVTDHRK